VRVVIGEASPLLRAGLARVAERAGFEVVGEAGDGADLLRKVRAHRPDVAVAGVDALDAVRAIRAELPGVGLLLLAEDADPAPLAGLGPVGVGYLLKGRIAELERVTDAIREVARGGSALDPEVVGRMLERRRRGEPFGALTQRERAVLAGMAEGESNRGIARRLFVSERAVERHITAIFAKLGVRASENGHRRVLAVLTYLGR
jgi:DNA-binding NarL/FixJ family response regulator